jgi:hypothetical protein
MTKEQRKRPKVITFLLRGSLILVILLIIAAASLLVYLNFKKNDISEDLLNVVNKELKGDFSVSSISLGSIYSYPNLQVSVNGLKFHAPSGPKTNGELILEVKTVKLNADLSDVFSKIIEIDNIYIKEAQLFIERDSLENMVISEGFQPIAPKVNETDSTNLSIHINNILIEDSQVMILDRPTMVQLPFNLKRVKGTFELENDLIQGVADIHLDSIHFTETEALMINGLPIQMSTSYTVDIDKDKVGVKGKQLYIGDELYRFDYDYDYSETSSMDFQMSSGNEGINLATLFVEEADTINDNKTIELLGQGAFKTDLHWKTDSKKPFFEALEAGFTLEGKELIIYGIDLDDVIEKFKRSQKFNLADVGAVMFAGPAGIAVTKGADFARLAFTKAGDSTQVKHFLAEWKMENGILATQDVALSTKTNLISTDGWYNIQNDSLDFKISVLDKRGCDLVGQRIYGEALNPEYGKVKLLKTFLGPVKNFFRNIGIAKCDTIYTGRVEHPIK